MAEKLLSNSFPPGDDSWPCCLGGVLYVDEKSFFFSVEVDADLCELLGEKVTKPILFEAETLAALLAASLWCNHFDNRRVILFVDNEGTKFSLLMGFSENDCVDRMSEAFAELEC